MRLSRISLALTAPRGGTPAPPAVAWLTITGTATENQTLTAALGGGAPVVTSYQWLRGYAPISGATSSTYTLTDADVGRVIRVVANGDQYSAPTTAIAGVNDTPTGSVTISGTATQGQTLTAVTTTIADPDGLGPFSYQWRRAGAPISGATAQTYTLVQADVGAAMSVVVSWTDQQGFSESLTSANTSAVANVNDAPTGVLTITGTPDVGQVLTMVTSSIADLDGLGPFTFSWLRDGVTISGATSSTYTLVAADIGTLITARVSYTDAQGTAETVTSAAVGPVTGTAPTGNFIALEDNDILLLEDGDQFLLEA